MLQAMMQADGDKRGTFGKGVPPVMEAFRLLATLEGYALGKPRMSSGDVIPVQALRSHPTVCASELEIEQLPNAPCWCPTTAFGTWVMRQGDRIMITGNTSAIGRALGFAGYAIEGGIASADEVRNSDSRENGHNPHSAPPPQAASKELLKKLGTAMKATGMNREGLELAWAELGFDGRTSDSLTPAEVQKAIAGYQAYNLPPTEPDEASLEF
jgi:hypothetical protein